MRSERTLIATVAGTLSLLASKAKTPNVTMVSSQIAICFTNVFMQGQKVMTASVETNQKRYTPAVHDQVRATRTANEFALTAYRFSA